MVLPPPALRATGHVTSGLLAGPWVAPLEACVSGVDTWSALGFLNLDGVLPGSLTQVLGCSKGGCLC